MARRRRSNETPSFIIIGATAAISLFVLEFWVVRYAYYEPSNQRGRIDCIYKQFRNFDIIGNATFNDVVRGFALICGRDV